MKRIVTFDRANQPYGFAQLDDNANIPGNVTASYALTASYVLNGGGGGTTDTGSLLVTASVSSNTITFTKGDTTTFNITVDTGSAIPIDTNSFATTGSNTFIGNQTISGTPSSGNGVLTIQNLNPLLVGDFTSGISLGAASGFADIRTADLTTQGLRFFASPYTLGSILDTATIQVWNTASAFPGQIYLDGGSHNDSAIIFRTAGEGEPVVERLRIKSNGDVSLSNSIEVSGSIKFKDGSIIQSVSASSGDGYGLTTLILKPDTSYSSDQYIILDPTAPNHIHIRAGGTIDNSTSELYLGGENSNVRVGAGFDPTIYIKSSGSLWSFENNGILKLNNGLGEIYADNNDFSVRIGNAPVNAAPNAQIILGGQNEIFKIISGPPLRQWTFEGNGDFNLTGSINGAANLATTGSNTFIGNQTITGSVSISGSLIIPITASSESITGSMYVDPANNKLWIYTGNGGVSGWVTSSLG